jgi:hypothetical protein
MPQIMPRRTIYLPESVENLVRKQALDNESFSATTVRLIELGALNADKEDWPEWIGSIEGPGDWGINFEKYIGLKPWGPGEGPKKGPSEKNPD